MLWLPKGGGVSRLNDLLHKCFMVEAMKVQTRIHVWGKLESIDKIKRSMPMLHVYS